METVHVNNNQHITVRYRHCVDTNLGNINSRHSRSVPRNKDQ